jgi:integrase
MGLDDLDDGVITSFWRKERPRLWRLRAVGLKSLQRMLAHLRSLGVVREPPKPRLPEAAVLARRFGEYLEQRRSLQPVTVGAMVNVAREFIEGCFGRGRVRLHALGEKEITRFVLQGADRPSSRGGPLSRDAVEALLKRYLAKASELRPELKGKKATPHTLRHSRAMSLLQHGVDRSVIALWLGHESVETTQIYLHADMGLKEKALAHTTPKKQKPARYRPGDKLLAFLEGL